MLVWIMNYGRADAIAFIGESPEVGGYRNALSEYGIIIEDGPVNRIECGSVADIPAQYLLEYDGMNWLVLKA
jgi:hypothetical protein